MSENQKETEVRQAFEGYEARKYKEWKKLKTENQQELGDDQKSFDAYIKAIQEKGKPVFILDGIHTDAVSKDYAKSTNVILRKSNKIYIANTFYDYGPYNKAMQQTAFNKLEVGDTCIIVSKISNTNKIYTYEAIYVSQSSGNGKQFQTFSCSVIDLDNIDGSGGSATVPNFTVDTAVTVPFEQGATVNLNKESDGNYKFSFQIPTGKQGPVGPAGPAGTGGSTYQIPLPNSGKNIDIKSVDGAYCVNLIDYRELSRNPFFGVGGKHGKTLYTRGKRKIEGSTTNGIHYAGPYTGIKKSKNIEVKYASISDTDIVGAGDISTPIVGGIDFTILKATEDEPQAIQNNIEHNKPKDTIKTKTIRNIDNYGNYYLNIGGTNEPEHIEMFFKPYYTSNEHLIPKGLTREFEFKEYNGHILRSNGTLNDAYYTGTNFNSIERKVGVCNLRDLQYVRYEELLGKNLEDIQIEAFENYIYFIVPNDCEMPNLVSDDDEVGCSRIGEKCITNNLSEVSEEDKHLDEPQHIPYFLSKLHIIDNTLGHIKSCPAKKLVCFQIALNHKYAYSWKDLLAKTQIIYPLDTNYITRKQIPEGGYCVHLADGTTIYSHNYNQIDIEDATKNGTYTFKGSKNGYPNIKIQISQIVSITPVSQ